MATKEFNAKQKEIVARKMGYDGPMQMFDNFLKSDPAMARKYGIVVDKYMAKGGAVMRAKDGGVVKKYQEGGTVTTTTTTEETPATTTAQQGLTPVSQTIQQTQPTPMQAPVVTPAQNVVDQGQLIQTQLAPTQAATAAPAAAVTATTAAAPTPTTAATYQAATAAPEVAQTLAGVKPAEGTVSQQAQVQAATMEPTSTAISGLQAAEGVATQITGAPIREVQTEELISGPAVNMDTVEQTLQKAEAAQGVVTEDMTVQGQLAKLTAGFEANNPPSWAAASLRGVTAVMAQRGLGASSLAGQAMIQATLEAALPIANADAQAYQQMGLQNLSNRQQIAVLAAQQRAQFLGQEFDQSFQARVQNASRIADVANQNFTAQQQIVLENARLAQTMDMANLSNRQALVMANAAQIASLEAQNLNNRQQAAVTNAQAFLQMDMANLSNAQQTELFRAQSNVQALLSDQAAANAALQFNATSENQVQQFYDSLVTQVGQFNATQNNSMAQFNTDQYNALQRFNSEQQNSRDQFNAQNRLVIDQSNAQWRREISTANTAAINRANEVNAQAALQVGLSEYNNQMQVYRDNIQYAFTSGENARNRENYVAIAVLQKEATVTAAKLALEGKMYEALGAVSAKVMEKTSVVQDGVNAISGVGSSLWKSVVSAFGGSAGGAIQIDNPSLPGDDAYGWQYYADPVSGDVSTIISPDGVYYDSAGNVVWDPNDYETNGWSDIPDYDDSWMTSSDYYSDTDDYFYYDYT